MTPDEMKELKELVEFLKENDLNEFEFERDDLKIRLKFAQPVQAAAASALDLARLGQLLTPGGHAAPFRLPGNPRRGCLSIGVVRCASGGSFG